MKMIIRFIILLLITNFHIVLATDNPHGEIKYDCETCHNIESFNNVKFDHSLTGYDLKGRHEVAECRGCHKIDNFNSVKSGCLSCHEDVHEAKLGSNCLNCHTFNGWENFDIQELHFSTNFPVTGRHALVDCQSCHTGLPSGDLALNTIDCVSCHQTEYLEVTNPNHVVNGFTTECQSCHQMERWQPALFDIHDIFFPIYSGQHNNKWEECANCHADPNNYQIFDCLSCHEHNQTETDGQHQGISSYAYDSPSCYICHPTGEAGEFLDHDALAFPIFSGSHANQWDDCRLCHINESNNKDVSCFGCHDHNQTTTDNFHSGIQNYSYISSACLSCHPLSQKGQYLDHDPLSFPIYSGRHANTWNDCNVCHTVEGNRTEFTCISCHEHNQTDTDNFHGSMNGYVYNSTDCYSCHPTGEKGQFLEHDVQFFPIFSGPHNNRWDNCETCHDVLGDRTQFTCFNCHNQVDMDDKHLGQVDGYVYDSNACYSCHPQ